MDHAARLLDVLQRYWGFADFRPLQLPAMRCLLEGRDAVVVLPTGGGKSLCYQAPALCQPGLAVVVSPLISLMKDQVDSLLSNGVPAAFANSSQTLDERRQVAADIRAGRLKLLYTAPERLVTERMLDFLSHVDVSLFAIDEAHCISAWGHDFRPEFRMLRTLRDRFPHVGISAFTATASEEVRTDIAEQLGLRAPEFIVGAFDRPNLVYKVRHRTDSFAQVREVLDRHRGESGIIYCIARRDVDKLCAALRALNYRAVPYHAGLSDDERRRNQDAFITEQADTVVATVAFGMGIDKSNVRYVVHAAMPKSLEHYQQESGRAGRDGLEAECLLLYSGGDYGVWKEMLTEMPPDARDGAVRSLGAMFGYCTSATCRHRALVQYFGQDIGVPCRACDVCLGELDAVPEPTVVGQKILSCVLRLKERFGSDYTALVLAGSREQRILKNGHESLSTWGLFRDEDKRTVREWIEQLVGQGFLEKTGEYQVLSVTPLGRKLLKAEVAPALYRPAAPKKPEAATDNWEGVDRDLFAALQALRLRLARERSVPAYIVFDDASLRDMARRRPTTSEGFRAVRGVGEKKQADFGAVFLELIVNHCREHGLTTDIAIAPAPATTAGAAPSRASDPTGPSIAAIATFPCFAAGMSLVDVAAKFGRARSTTLGYLSDYLRHEKVTDPSPWVAPELAARICAAIESAGPDRLKPIFESLGGTVTYDEIRIVLECWRNRPWA